MKIGYGGKETTNFSFLFKITDTQLAPAIWLISNLKEYQGRSERKHEGHFNAGFHHNDTYFDG